MRVELFDVNGFVAANELVAVTNPIYLNADRTPTDDGLFSYKIFGIPGSRERREMCAYIDLGVNVIHPLIYDAITKMDKRIAAIAGGDDYYVIGKSGELVKVEDEDTPGAGTGIPWLVENLKKIKFPERDSEIRKVKFDLIDKTPESEMFPSKIPVIPAFYRDLNFSKLDSGKLAVEELNDIYVKIMSASASVRKSAEVGFIAVQSHNRLQNLVGELFEYFTRGKIAGKTGYIKQYAQGKAVDYTARLVITTSKYSGVESYADAEVKTDEIGIPLHAACAIFAPIVNKTIREIFSENLSNRQKMFYGGRSRGVVDLASESLSDKNIGKMLSLFKNSVHDRFVPIMVENEKGKSVPWDMWSNILGRPMTITDILFIGATVALRDKFVIYTRYPVESHQSTVAARPVIITTEKTIPMDFGSGTIGSLPRYPDPKYAELWRDSAILNPSLTGIMGADFDGDQISITGLFTQEANEELKKLSRSRMSLVRADGTPARGPFMESILTLYTMTK